ncbi:MAG: disulfide bond formation protein B [Pseudomonadota bacterium]
MLIARLGPSPSQVWATLTVLLSGGLLCVALILEHAQGLAPCPLCMMQRIWVMLVGLLAYASLLHNPRWGIYPLLTAVAACIGGYFSIRQLWLQSLPADEVPACGPELQYMIEVFPLVDVLSAMTSGTGDCAEVVWSFLGLSIPAWALVGFTALLVCAIMQLRSAGK